MRKSDIRSVTVYDIEIYGQRILTAQIERVQYKYILWVPIFVNSGNVVNYIENGNGRMCQSDNNPSIEQTTVEMSLDYILQVECFKSESTGRKDLYLSSNGVMRNDH